MGARLHTNQLSPLHSIVCVVCVCVCVCVCERERERKGEGDRQVGGKPKEKARDTRDSATDVEGCGRKSEGVAPRGEETAVSRRGECRADTKQKQAGRRTAEEGNAAAQWVCSTNTICVTATEHRTLNADTGRRRRLARRGAVSLRWCGVRELCAVDQMRSRSDAKGGRRHGRGRRRIRGGGRGT